MTLKLNDACWKYGAAVCAVTAVALGLGGCDSRTSPEAPRAPASASAPDPNGDAIGPLSPAEPAPASAPAPAATAVAPPPAPITSVKGNEFRRPYAAQPGAPELKSLESLIGTYPHDGAKYLEQGVLAERLKRLLDSRYGALLKNLQTSGPLTKEGDVWMVTGNRQHQGGTDAAAVVIDPARNALRVWLMRSGTQTVYTDLREGEIAWPESVKTMIGNATPPAGRK
ncbi:hypothetical protein [Diaphorobacter ruginosibacter]|uniref:hypothetical protein n=1 Tax=Diaphorobacter ruginosibacter TaxID=1715720 RepID=UPI001CB74090|nr:hypothetical protein [Diaphorobacter ruginosibacter]